MQNNEVYRLGQPLREKKNEKGDKYVDFGRELKKNETRR